MGGWGGGGWFANNGSASPGHVWALDENEEQSRGGKRSDDLPRIEECLKWARKGEVCRCCSGVGGVEEMRGEEGIQEDRRAWKAAIARQRQLAGGDEINP